MPSFYAWTCPLFLTAETVGAEKSGACSFPCLPKGTGGIACRSSSGPSGAERLLWLGTAPASVRPNLHARGFARMIAPVRTVKNILSTKYVNVPEKGTVQLSYCQATLLLPYFGTGLSCTGKKPILVRHKFRRVALCQCSHICKTFFRKDKG